MDLRALIVCLVCFSQCSLAATAITTIVQANGSCSTIASPMPTALVHNALLPEPQNLTIALRVPNYQGAVYDWAGCYIKSTDSLLGSVSTNVSILTPVYCADWCANYTYFSLLEGNGCACSSHLPSELVVDQRSCNASCSGNLSEACGSNGYLQTYEKEPCVYGCLSTVTTSGTTTLGSLSLTAFTSSQAAAIVSTLAVSSSLGRSRPSSFGIYSNFSNTSVSALGALQTSTSCFLKKSSLSLPKTSPPASSFSLSRVSFLTQKTSNPSSFPRITPSSSAAVLSSSISLIGPPSASRAANTQLSTLSASLSMATSRTSTSSMATSSTASSNRAVSIISSTTTIPNTAGALQTAALLLSKPTPLANNKTDEDQFVLSLPFNLTLYTETSPNVSITTNGLFAVANDNVTADGYMDQPQALYSDSLVPGTAMPWWHYMFSDGQNQRGVYYQIDNSNHLSVEFLLLDQSGTLTHFIVTYSSQNSGNINFYYITTGDGGANSTIGVQGQDSNGDNVWLQASNMTAGSVEAGTLLQFSTPSSGSSDGTWSKSSTFKLSCFPPGTFPAGTCGSPAP